MKLTPRLQAIADKVNKGNRVADIGTDHGYIPIYLIEKALSSKVIAADINEGPLDNARRQIQSKGLSHKITTRLGSGLRVLEPSEVDTVIIAGMGGLLIRDILMDSPQITKTVKQFILQPMVAQAELREWLVNNGFKIVDEVLVKEGQKYYEIILAENGRQTVEEAIYFHIGQKLFENKDPLLEEFILKHITIQKDILNSLEGQKTYNARQKYTDCRIKIQKLEEVLECLKNASQ